MNSYRVQQMRKLKLSDIQKDLVIGSLLGDGYLMPTTCGCSFRAHHSDKQKDYLNWKHSVLENIVNTGPKRDSPSSYFFRTVSHPGFNKYRRMFYDKNNGKIISSELFKILNPRGLAIWIMDDGSKDGKCLRINSQSFSYPDNLLLKNILEGKFRIRTNIHQDKGLFRLWIKSESMKRLRKIVLPFIVSSMFYKLSP